MHRRHVVLSGLASLFVKDALAEGVMRVRGAALVNGNPVGSGAKVKVGDTIVTGPQSEIVFVVGRDAMLVRQNSSFELAEKAFRLTAGAVLAVFAPRQRKEVVTNTATIGIRGTAIYVEAERQRSYVCTCYGETVLGPLEERSRETVRPAQRHDPRYVYARGAPRMLAPAPMINHSEAELELLQKLVR